MADQTTILERQLFEARALLDLSYARETALVTALGRSRDLLEGASVAPDKQELLPTSLAAIDAIFEELKKPPAPPHGLFIRHAKLVCELAGAKKANEYIRRQLDSEMVGNANYEVQVRDMRTSIAELRAEQRALLELINDPAVCERVMEAAKQLMPEPQFKEGEHRE